MYGRELGPQILLEVGTHMNIFEFWLFSSEFWNFYFTSYVDIIYLKNYIIYKD